MAIIKQQEVKKIVFNETFNIINESISADMLIDMSFKDIKLLNNGNYNKTMQDLNALMNSLEGSAEEQERKAYFKAKKFSNKLAKKDRFSGAESVLKKRMFVFEKPFRDWRYNRRVKKQTKKAYKI